MSVPILITFIAYLVILLAIGFGFYRESSSIEDYLPGCRGMGSWVMAFSAHASDMSGGLLMGLPMLIENTLRFLSSISRILNIDNSMLFFSHKRQKSQF